MTPFDGSQLTMQLSATADYFVIDYVTTYFSARNRNIDDNAAVAMTNMLNFFLERITDTAGNFRMACCKAVLDTDDIRGAIEGLGVEDMIKLPFYTPFGFNSKPDNVVEISSILEHKPLPVNADIIVRPHWLVIDGVQPRIPENPVPDVVVDESIDLPSIPEPGAKSLLLKEAGKKVPRVEDFTMKTTSTHTVSLEQQVFFKDIIETIVGNDKTKRNEAIYCLHSDPGLQTLVGRFSTTITEGIKVNIAHENVSMLIYLIAAINALVANPNINLEKHLFDIIPAILSCIVTRVSDTKVADPSMRETWIRLRVSAAKLLCNVCRSYKSENLKYKVIRILCDVITNPHPYLPAVYGAVNVLTHLGNEPMESVVFPNLRLIRKAMDSYQPAAVFRGGPGMSATNQSDERSLLDKMLRNEIEKYFRNNSSYISDMSSEQIADQFGPYAHLVER